MQDRLVSRSDSSPAANRPDRDQSFITLPPPHLVLPLLFVLFLWHGLLYKNEVKERSV